MGATNKSGLVSLFEGLKKHWSLATVLPFFLGLLTFYEGFGEWWFGFWPKAWPWLVGSVVLFVIFWLILFCKYLWDRQENKVDTCNTILVIALPFLLLGFFLASFFWHWRNTEKVVILVEQFKGAEKGADVARSIKSHLDKAIHFPDRRCVKVILGKNYEEDSKEIPLHEHAIKCRADMIISGWYKKTGNTTLVCVNFHLANTPKSFPAVFRGRENRYPETFIFSEQEMNNFNIDFCLGKLLTHEFKLILGAGAYASGNWEMAEKYFDEALKSMKSNKESVLQDSCPKNDERKKLLEIDEALLHLYSGYSLVNQDKLTKAITQFSEAIKLCERKFNTEEKDQETTARAYTDAKYQEILARAYMGRGITYRERNSFKAATADFQKVERCPLRSDELKLGGEYDFPENMVELNNLAENYLKDGDNYLKDGMLVHAQAELEISEELFSRLSKKALLTAQKRQYDYGLAQSIVRLGEAHNRQALHEIRDDEHTNQAIKCLNDALKVIEDLEGQGGPGRADLLVLKADCLRHLGDAHRAIDMIEKVEKAIGYHTDAEKLWEMDELKDYKGAGSQAGGELARIGDVYRRLCDLEYDSNEKKLNEIIEFYNSKAIFFYEEAIKKRGGEAYLNALYSNQPDQQARLAQEEKDLIEKSMEEKNAHHLASSLGNLAETLINRENPNDLKTAIKLLECAGECFRRAQEKLDEEDPDWTKKLEEERNQTLRDDLAWCLTFHGYALVRQGPPEDANESIETKYYEEAKKILDEAEKNHRKLPSDKVDKFNLALNRFALVIPLFELNQNWDALKTFHDACLRLRRMTREQKKIWHTDYVCNMFKKLQEAEIKVDGKTLIDKEKYDHLNAWLSSTHVRAGRQTLEEIIGEAEEELTLTK